jgi:hypothetical protein
MNTERESLIKIADERGITVNKFWSTKKLALEVNAGVTQKERRLEAMRRAGKQHRCRVYTLHRPVGLGGLDQAAFIPEILFFRSVMPSFSFPSRIPCVRCLR